MIFKISICHVTLDIRPTRFFPASKKSRGGPRYEDTAYVPTIMPS